MEHRNIDDPGVTRSVLFDRFQHFHLKASETFLVFLLFPGIDRQGSLKRNAVYIFSVPESHCCPVRNEAGY